MATEFERVFDENLKDALVGETSSGIDSNGDPTSGWNTEYNIRAYKELKNPVFPEVAERNKTESEYLIMCPIESTSGEELELKRTYSIVFGSSYDEDADEYKIRDFEKIEDDHFEIEAYIIRDRG